ncbi:DUF4911 domain-containing protein [Desulfosarcina sp.]|uniref:DUF4911 domain-containing protein n=1 Tax=Desulfosarcina sp. TaxID=2027861 RepID=UPI003970FA96
MKLQTTRRCYRVDRRQISFVKFILEAYDNVAVMSTLDPHVALVRIVIAPGCEDLVNGIVDSFAGQFEVVPVKEASLTGRTAALNRQLVVSSG